MAMSRRRRGVALTVAVVAGLGIAPLPTTRAQAGGVGKLLPELVGQWFEPFEEGGGATPRCRTDEEPGWAHGSLICKPAAADVIALPDGRVLYWDGLEGSENVQTSYGPEISPKSRNAEARVLDLRRGTPEFITPTPKTGGGTPREHAKGYATDEPFGMAGVPGRPGDGLVGSTWGAAGLPEQRPSASQNDHYWADTDLFCSDLAGMADGRVLIAGGIDWYNEPDLLAKHRGEPADVGFVELGGLKTTRIFDPKTDTFTEAADMHHPRWYPTLVELPDGKFLAASGVVKLIKSTQLSSIRRTETYDPAANTWTVNYVGPQSENSLPMIPRLHLMPNGKVLYVGGGEGWAPSGHAADEALWGLQQLFDPAKKTWEVAAVAPFGMARDIPYSILLPLKPPYDKGTVLTFGGSLGPSPSAYVAVPFATLTTVDGQGSVTNEMTGNLNEARWSPAGVPLADGTVLAMAGSRNSHTEAPGFDISVHSAEIYDPATGKWTKAASALRDRPYHYSATLLADGRVLLGGYSPIGTMTGPHRSVGGPFANNNRDASFEVFSPPYLFRGQRPKISHAPAGIAWGESFTVETPDAAAVRSVLLVKLPSQQHAMDSNSRTVELSFRQAGSGRLEVAAPPGGAVAPPGAYYLFVNRENPGGLTPSVARIVFVGDRHDGAEAVRPFPDDFGGVGSGSATPVTGGPRGEDTYLGPAGTAANQALAGAGPAVAALQDGTAKLDLSSVRYESPWATRRRAATLLM